MVDSKRVGEGLRRCGKNASRMLASVLMEEAEWWLLSGLVKQILEKREMVGW